MSFMLQLCLTLAGGAGLALQTGCDVSRNTQEVITLENPLFEVLRSVRFGSEAVIHPDQPNVRFAPKAVIPRIANCEISLFYTATRKHGQVRNDR